MTVTDPDGEDDDEGLALGSIFTEPPRPPSPEPTIAVYENLNIIANFEDSPSPNPNPSPSPWSTISVRLVGNHPLWGHHLWNAARALAGFLQRNPVLYADRTVLELGAGGGLPGLVAAKCGARKVVLTDYPDKALLDNLAYNVAQNLDVWQLSPSADADAVCGVVGYVWGNPVGSLLDALLPGPDTATQVDTEPGPGTTGFDLIILSDLIFNHSQHRALLATCERTIAPGGCVLVFYTHHRPHLAPRDMDFFKIAAETSWKCEEVLTERFPPMFPEDPGEEEVRSTVHGWKLIRVSP